MRYYVINDYTLKLFEGKDELKEHIKETPLDHLDVPRYNHINVTDQAKAMGYKTFDCALPIDFVRDFEEKTGIIPVGRIVYRYDGNVFGYPAPITREGEVALKIYEHIKRGERG